MRYFFFLFFIIFSGCSTKDYTQNQSKLIIIKSPKIKFSDLGYIRNNNKDIKLELFIAGRAIEDITIHHLICVKNGCMSKSNFNKEYLYFAYPSDILQNILLGKEIYGGKNKVKKNGGFEQRIHLVDVDIVYKVYPHTIFFKDKKNRIIFKIKDI
ncbi:Putative lipoprotein [hydrothermal vent metagenome]|uniref:Putative lipoprotein n=1 Tax=hydrothermal vent metagenome TaxID=652676 RepID=A0A1W1D1T6_9ZZZZ